MFTERVLAALSSVAGFAVNPNDAKRARASVFLKDQGGASVRDAACVPRWPRSARPGTTEEEGGNETLDGSGGEEERGYLSLPERTSES